MKTTALVLLCAFCAFHAAAQIRTTNIQTAFKTDIYSIQQLPDGNTALLLETNNHHLDGVWEMAIFDSAGQQVLQIPLQSFSGFMDFSFVQLKEGYLLTSMGPFCDWYEPRALFYFDTVGTYVGLVYGWYPNYTFPDILKLLPGPSSSFWCFSNEKKPVRFNYNGAQIAVSDQDLGLYKKMIPEGDDHYLLQLNEGFARVNDSLTQVVFALQNTQLLDIARAPDGYVYALSYNRLYRFTADLSSYTNTVLPTQSSNTRLVSTNDGVYLYRPNIQPELTHFSNQLIFTGSLTLPQYSDFTVEHIQKYGDQWHLIGHVNGNNWKQIVSYQVFDADFTPAIRQQDAAIEDINLSTASYIQFPYFSLKGIKVLIKNAGQDTLKSVRINTAIQPYNGICPSYIDYYERFTVDLPPNDSVYLDVPDINYYSQYLIDDTSQYYLCFWTTLPNDSLDGHPDNDRYCIYLPDHLISQTEAATEADAPLVFPNPTNGKATIRVADEGSPEGTYTVHNSLGQTIFTGDFQSNPIEIDLQTCKKGLYWLSLQYRSGKIQYLKIILE